jgi:hypothetical protein
MTVLVGELNGEECQRIVVTGFVNIWVLFGDYHVWLDENGFCCGARMLRMEVLMQKLWVKLLDHRIPPLA